MKNITASTSSRQYAPRSGRGPSGVSRLVARALLPFILLSFVIASSSLADTVILATGVSGGTPLAQGVIDPNWTITGAAGYSSTYVLGSNVTVGNNWGGGAWFQPSTAQWIGAANWNGPSWTHPEGAQLLPTSGYTFQTTFNLSTFNLSTVTISGGWTIDDGGILAINGHTVSTVLTGTDSRGNLQPGTGPFWHLTDFAIDPSWLHQGDNTLTITMTQADQANEGTVLYATVTGSPVPVPAALLLFAPGLAALMLVRKRLKK